VYARATDVFGRVNEFDIMVNGTSSRQSTLAFFDSGCLKDPTTTSCAPLSIDTGIESRWPSVSNGTHLADMALSVLPSAAETGCYSWNVQRNDPSNAVRFVVCCCKLRP